MKNDAPRNSTGVASVLLIDVWNSTANGSVAPPCANLLSIRYEADGIAVLSGP